MSQKVTVVEHGKHDIECPECNATRIVSAYEKSKCLNCGCVFILEDIPDKTPEELFFERVKGKKIVYLKFMCVPETYVIPVKMKGPVGFEDDNGNVWAIIDPTIPGPCWKFYEEPTPEQVFFDAVKGKKIRWTFSGPESWFIPESLNGRAMSGDSNHGRITMFVAGGFNGKDHWELYTEPEPVKKSSLDEVRELLHELSDAARKSMSGFYAVGGMIPGGYHCRHSIDPIILTEPKTWSDFQVQIDKDPKPRATLTLRNAADWTDEEATEIANWLVEQIVSRKGYYKKVRIVHQ